MTILIQHSDPTGTVDFQNPAAVRDALDDLLLQRYGTAYAAGYRQVLVQALDDLVAAFRGDFPGLLRCDTHYHDVRHALDSGLAMARLIDGHCLETPVDAAEHLTVEYAVLGILLALFHDIGLLRRHDEFHVSGASLTPFHEARGVAFMQDYLLRPAMAPLAHLAELSRLIMVTRLVWRMPAEMAPIERVLACLLGTADIVSQLADRCYLEKCRDFLYVEFSAIGLAGAPELTYPDPEALLRNTPAFYSGLLSKRIRDEYAGADHYLQRHFAGKCPYEAAINRNFRFLSELLDASALDRLSRQPQRLIDLARPGPS
ncbi:MAG: hypothetical protein KUL75_03090 [Sterolibacterium sp.]|nr:hypothetical protein [Sterolibacterium sp.]